MHMDIHKDHLVYQQKNTGAYSFGWDFIGLSYRGNLNFWWLVNGINSTNSNFIIHQWEDREYTLAYNRPSRTSTIDVFISINNTSYPILRCTRFVSDNRLCKWVDGTVQLFWVAHRLIELGEIESELSLIYDVFGEDDYNLLMQSNITRYDAKVDLMYNRARPCPKYSLLLDTRSISIDTYHTIWDTEGLLNNRQFKQLTKALDKDSNEILSNVKNCLNKEWIQNGWSTLDNNNYIVRVYQKQLDVIKKKKFALYSDYFNYASVWRIEVQMGYNALKDEYGNRYTLAQLDEVKAKAKAYFGLSYITQGKIYRPTHNGDVIQAMQPYLCRFHNMANNLRNNKVDPITQVAYALIHKGNVSGEQVIESLDTTKNLIQQGKLESVVLSAVHSNTQHTPKQLLTLGEDCDSLIT